MASHSSSLPTLPNKEYCLEVTHTPAWVSSSPSFPPIFKIDEEKKKKEFHIVTSSLVRNMDEPFSTFLSELETEILNWPLDTFLGIFPEYCWRLTPPEEVLTGIKTRLINNCLKERNNLVIVFGTLEFTLNKSYTSNAIVYYQEELAFVPKEKILSGEVAQEMKAGTNPGVMVFPHFRLGVLVCADLWEPSLLMRLCQHEMADILAVPAWTATSPGNRLWARLDWHALARTRSTEYSVIVAVADHRNNRPTTDVANATCIFDPSNRHKPFPTDPFIDRDLTLINMEQLHEARQKWRFKGLAPR